MTGPVCTSDVCTCVCVPVRACYMGVCDFMIVFEAIRLD